jgi:hypothetical protein
MEWQPIETAPKDGTTIIATGLNYGTGPGRHLALVYWDQERHTPGWYDRAESGEDYIYLAHWCEVDIPSLSTLPEPPTSLSASREGEGV